MNGSAQRLPLTIWVGLGLLFSVLGLMYLLSLVEYSRARQKALPVIDQVADFTLTNQDGNVTTLADLSNQRLGRRHHLHPLCRVVPDHVHADEIVAGRAAVQQPGKTGDADDRSRL